MTLRSSPVIAHAKMLLRPRIRRQEKAHPARLFLAEIDSVTPWSMLHKLVEPFYSKVEGAGRPPIGLSRMRRMYVAQQCFSLSDEGSEDSICDSQAIRALVGIDLGRESAPDATTLLKFRHMLEAKDLTRQMFDTINQHLAEKGLMMREGPLLMPR